MQTISCLVDADQFATADFKNFGYVVSSVRMGRKNYEAYQIKSPDGTPQALDLPTDPKKSFPCYRLVEFDPLLKHVFVARSREGIAGSIVLNGNDYAEGGARVTLALLRKDVHRPLIDFISDMSSYRQATDTSDATKLQQLDATFQTYLALLPKSKFISELTLSSFYDLQQATQGIFSTRQFNKRELSERRKESIKSELQAQGSASKATLSRQVNFLNQTRSKPLKAHNYRHLAHSLWPTRKGGGGVEQTVGESSEEAAGGGTSHGERGGASGEIPGQGELDLAGEALDQTEGGRATTSEGEPIDVDISVEGHQGEEDAEGGNGKQREGGIREAPLSYKNKALPFQRKKIDDFQDQVQQFTANIKISESLPKKKPLPNQQATNVENFEDAKARFLTIQRRSAQVFRRLKLKGVAKEDQFREYLSTLTSNSVFLFFFTDLTR
jgi:hypothetical protein